MRGLRSTLFLLVVLLGLGGYIYFVEWKKPPASDVEAKQKVFGVEPGKVEELRVKSASGEIAALKKTGNEWQIVEPAPTRADEAEVSAITSNLSSLEIQRVVDENAADLKEFGLAEPRVDVAFKATGDKEFKHLLIGDKTATGGDLYAKLPNEKKVFLISGYLDSTFNRTPFDLRDKTILKFERDKIDAVEIVTPDHSVQLTKSASDWTLARPVEARGDYGTVEGVIGRLQSAQMKSIVSPEAKDLKQYGLDKPEVTVTLGAGSTRATLALGKAAPEGPENTDSKDGTVYARDASRPAVFTVEKSLLDDLTKPAWEYRRKDVFEFRAFNATRIEITRGAEKLAFEKFKGKSADGKETEDKWRRIAPTGDAAANTEADATKIDSLLTKLANLRAESFADAKTKTGLDARVATVVVKFDEGKKEERVTFGRAGSDVYAERTGEAGAAKLDANEFNEAMKALDELKPGQT